MGGLTFTLLLLYLLCYYGSRLYPHLVIGRCMGRPPSHLKHNLKIFLSLILFMRYKWHIKKPLIVIDDFELHVCGSLRLRSIDGLLHLLRVSVLRKRTIVYVIYKKHLLNLLIYFSFFFNGNKDNGSLFVTIVKVSKRKYKHLRDIEERNFRNIKR